MSAWAKAGSKCVCVDSYEHPELVEGQVYLISKVSPYGGNGLGKYPNTRTILTLSGVNNWSGINGFAIERFKPIATKTQEQDVSMFKSLLNKTPINETA